MAKVKIAVIVDAQVDFFTGALKNDNAIKIIPNLVKKVADVRKAPNVKRVYWTKDTHRPADDYLKTEEGRNLPVPHCEEGTAGWMIIPELASYMSPVDEQIMKDGFGSFKLAKEIAVFIDALFFDHEINSLSDVEIEFFGVCTDICVISNVIAVKSYIPNVHIIVDASCCAGVTSESHKTAIEAMRSLQVEIINYEEV